MKKTYSERLEESSFVASDGDPELLLAIPFTTPVNLHTLVIIGGEAGRAPSKVRVFADNSGLDLACVEDEEPVQELDISEDFCGVIEYPLKVTRLRNVQLLHLHIPENFGAETSEVFFIGLRGEKSG